jgi:hypothetical protein
MAHVTYGGVVSNKGVNLTCVGHTVLAVGTWVCITDPYHVELPDSRGDLGVCGYILVANKNAGDDVTVASRFQLVETFTMGGAVNAGDPVVAGTNGKLYAYDPSSSPGSADSCCSILGIALTDAGAAGLADVGIF